MNHEVCIDMFLLTVLAMLATYHWDRLAICSLFKLEVPLLGMGASCSLILS